MCIACVQSHWDLEQTDHAVEGVCIMLHLFLGGAILLRALLQHVAHLLGITIAVVHDAGSHSVVPAGTPCFLQTSLPLFSTAFPIALITDWQRVGNFSYLYPPLLYTLLAGGSCMGPACNEQAMQHNVGMCSTASGCMSCQLYNIKLCLAIVTYETSNVCATLW